MKELRIHNKEKLIYALLCVVTLGVFLLDSRVPALLDKASTDPFTSTSGLGFQTNEILSVLEKDGPLLRSFKLLVNWFSSNFIGMSFGLCFSVAVSLFFQNNFRFKYKIPSGLGLIFGSQVGVCVNCASPLIYSFKKNKLNTRLGLGLISSSPTLNIIVLYLGFSLLPLHLFLLKLAFVFIYLFLVIPMFVPKSFEVSDNYSCEYIREITWTKATYSSFLSFWKELKTLLKVFLPIMLISAIVGVFLFDHFNDFILVDKEGGIGAILLFSAIGLLIPAPLTFDILFVSILYNAGLGPGVSAALLFTLGIYSPISAIVIGQNYGYKLAFKLALCVFVLGVLSGLCFEYFLELKSFEVNESTITSNSKSLKYPELSKTQFLINKDKILQTNLKYEKVLSGHGFKIYETSLLNGINQSEKFKKERVFNGKKDLRISNHLNIKGTLAAINLDDDDSPEIMAVHDWSIGLYKFKNSHIAKIGSIRVPRSQYTTFFIPLDINLDGYTDFLTGAEKGSKFVFYINQKNYSFKKMTSNIPRGDDNIITYGLFNDDLKVDLLLSKQNGEIYLYYGSNDLSFTEYKLPMNQIGEGLTHSVLITDLDSDQNNEMLIGNDLQNPDRFYEQNQNSFIENRNLLNQNPVNTMSILTADFNNDGLEDLFFTDMIYRNKKRFFFQDQRCGGLKGEPKYYCYSFYDLKKAIKDYDISACEKMNNQELKKSCFENIVINMALHKKNAYWKDVPINDQLKITLETLLKKSKRPFPNQVWQNAFFIQNKKNNFTEVSEEYGVDKTDWSWSAVAADFNNDSFTDLFVSNGSNHHFYETSNLLFLNKRGRKFELAKNLLVNTKENTFHSISLDLDNDGDLDLAELGSMQHLTFHHNSFGSNSAIFSFSYKGKKNIPNIKCLFELNGTKVLKEINMTGNYMSFNSKDCHIGLGKSKFGKLIEVRVGNKIKRRLDFAFKAGKKYKIQLE